VWVLDEKGVPIGARKGIAKEGLPAKTLSKEGWPDLPYNEAPNFNSAEPVTLKPGTKIYRIIDDGANPAGGYWNRKASVKSRRVAERLRGQDELE
jgi:hypothetical protein